MRSGGSDEDGLQTPTFIRTDEVIAALRSEFDFLAAPWTILRERMKAGKERRAPLSAAVVAQPRASPRECDDSACCDCRFWPDSDQLFVFMMKLKGDNH